MFLHILLTYYRNVLKSRIHLVTIVAGLSIGIAVSALIYIYVEREVTYDLHHTDADQIFRINTILEMEGKIDRTAKAGLNVGEALMEFYPQVISHTQFLNVQKQTVRIGAELHSSEVVVYADSNACTFFNYPFVEGNAVEALTGPNKAVIARSIAQQYFGSVAKAMGNTMEINKNNFLVTGIYDDSKFSTHIPYKIFLSLTSLPRDFRDQRNREFMWLTTYNYIKLRKGISHGDFEKELAPFNNAHLVPYVKKNEVNGAITFELEPVRDIHLDTTLRFDFPGAINPNYLKIFSIVAVLTLLIALINYVNLTTAKVSNRLKEIGIKKSIGASRFSLFFQFMVETVLTVYFSFLISLVLINFSLPTLNKLTSKTFLFFDVVDARFLGTAIFALLGFSIIASIYPALLLSSFKPVVAIRTSKKITGNSLAERLLSPAAIRRVLVTIQFSVSIFLIIGTLLILRQFRYLSAQDLGFNQQQVLVIDIPNDTTVSNHLDVVKNNLMQISSVKSVSCSSSIPGSDHGAVTMNVSQSGGSEIKVINIYIVDEKFLEALDIGLVDGRFFSREFATDPQQAFVVNEAAVKFLGWDAAIGKDLVSPLGQEGNVVGVVKDFNYKSLHSSIEPLILMNSKNSNGYLMVKVSSGNISNTVKSVSDVWTAFDNSHPYEYFFLDEKFQKQYETEQKLVMIFTYFASLAIFISCLGLIGLAIYTNEQRVKEIGIRKALGATSREIVWLLSSGFMTLIVIANVFAWPLSYFLIQNWLNDFAYRITIGPGPFLFGGLIAFCIGLATIGYFAFRASREAVVKALKYD